MLIFSIWYPHDSLEKTFSHPHDNLEYRIFNSGSVFTIIRDVTLIHIVFVLELFNTAASVDELLLTGEERVTS